MGRVAHGRHASPRGVLAGDFSPSRVYFLPCRSSLKICKFLVSLKSFLYPRLATKLAPGPVQWVSYHADTSEIEVNWQAVATAAHYDIYVGENVRTHAHLTGVIFSRASKLTTRKTRQGCPACKRMDAPSNCHLSTRMGRVISRPAVLRRPCIVRGRRTRPTHQWQLSAHEISCKSAGITRAKTGEAQCLVSKSS